jgi:hypothetical protein
VTRYWNADSDRDFEDANAPDREFLSCCDCCGEMKYGCVDLVFMGMDTHACPTCRGEPE